MLSVVKNEAKNRLIDRPHLAISLPSASATGQTTLGQEGAIIFGCRNIDLRGEQLKGSL